MYGLTPMVYSRNLLERTQTEFGGIDRRGGAGDGTLRELMNMSADRYPLLTARKPRYQVGTVTAPNGMLVRPGCRVWVDGTDLIVDGETVGQVADSRKVMELLGDRVCIWPDKVAYDRATGELKALEASWSGSAAFGDGTYAGETALANTISVAEDLTGLFCAGDAVAVTVTDGLNTEPQGPFVIQEIEYEDGYTELRFYEETWRAYVPETASSDTESADDGMTSFPSVEYKHTITIARRVPELDILFEHHNRLWGAKGNAIYTSKLGDPANWEVYEGLSTDAWELELGTPGEITGGVSYGGRPIFFKERSIIKIYGDTPSQYETSQTDSLGVESGSGGSLAVAGDVLFYKSIAGVMAYSGGYPSLVSEALGQERYRDATAGSDGVRYFVSMVSSGGVYEMWVYDTRHGTWCQEDGRNIMAFGWDGELYALEGIGVAALWLMGDVRESDGVREEGLSTAVEFNDWTDGSLRKKGVGKLYIRLEVDEGHKVQVMVQYDSSGSWETVRAIDGAMVKGMTEIPLTLRRCDHYRLRFVSSGLAGTGWTLHALAWRRYGGSARK